MRKELMYVIGLLNKEERLLKEIGEGKMKVTGKGTKTEELQENFRNVMVKLNAANLIDDTPEEVIEFFENNLEVFGEKAELGMTDTPEEVTETKEVKKVGDKKPEKKKEKPKKVDKKPDKKKEKKKKYTRAMSFCDALKGKPKTLTEMAEKAMKLYSDANPGKKERALDSVMWEFNKYYLEMLLVLKVIKLENDKYSLVE